MSESLKLCSIVITPSKTVDDSLCENVTQLTFHFHYVLFTSISHRNRIGLEEVV